MWRDTQRSAPPGGELRRQRRPKKVAPATAARVREAIELLGYRPNMSARALKHGTYKCSGY
jgi:DNA-binding LacI/PurR family transcriptional regulator